MSTDKEALDAITSGLPHREATPEERAVFARRRDQVRDLEAHVAKLRRELGLNENDGADAVERIHALWLVVAAARYLVRWWDYPGMTRGIQHPLVAEQETRLREAIATIGGKPSDARGEEAERK